MNTRMREALDNATASLETVMAHYGEQMTPEDRKGRERVIAEAREALAAPDAAAEMLAALQQALDSGQLRGCLVEKVVSAAIAKAEGRKV